MKEGDTNTRGAQPDPDISGEPRQSSPSPLSSKTPLNWKLTDTYGGIYLILIYFISFQSPTFRSSPFTILCKKKTNPTRYLLCGSCFSYMKSHEQFCFFHFLWWANCSLCGSLCGSDENQEQSAALLSRVVLIPWRCWVPLHEYNEHHQVALWFMGLCEASTKPLKLQ